MHFTCWDHKKGHLILLVEGIWRAPVEGKVVYPIIYSFFMFFLHQVVVNMNWIFPKNHGISNLVAWRCNETLCNTDPNPSFLEGPNDSLGWWNCDEFHFSPQQQPSFCKVSFTLLRCRESVKRKKRRYQARRRKKPRLRRIRIWSGDFEHFFMFTPKIRKDDPSLPHIFFNWVEIQLNHQLVN